jgi:hypothetical protein
MFHALRVLFSGWSKENLWIFIVDLLILGLIFLREYVWDALVWLRRRHLASVDRVVLEHLGRAAPGTHQKVDQISRAIGVELGKVRASLERLRDKREAEQDPQGEWHAARSYVDR